MNPLIGNLGPTELFIILGIVVLLFGAKKLPELARGSGRALRIFKSETKGLVDGDDETKPEPPSQIEASQSFLDGDIDHVEAERIVREQRDGA